MVYFDHVETRLLVLTMPSLAVLDLLVVHSFRTLSRPRALIFWCGVAGYGVLRGVVLRLVIAHGSGGSFPYAIRKPLFPVFGVSLQEISGWAIVAYLGWWLGARLSRYLFAQIAWACLFLGAISWAVESAAVAAGWWHWTVPVSQPLFVNVPFIAIVDWLFVGIDFLLPFAVITAPALRKRKARFAALLAFPVHFAAHAFAGSTLAGVPIHHLAHWALIGAVIWLAMRDAAIDEPFGLRRDWLPIAGLSLMLADVAAVELFMAHRPELLSSLLPAVAIVLQSLAPSAGYAMGAVALALSIVIPAFALAAAPAATSVMLASGRRWGRFAPVVAMLLLVVAAYEIHAHAARDQAELRRGLDLALAARDRGDLGAARRELTQLAARHPGTHVPLALLGEIDYRTDRLDEARASFLRAVAIKQDDAKGYRYLAVIERRLGRLESARKLAAKGLELDAHDPELRYLSGQAVEPADPQAALNLASLAFEVDDAKGAIAALDRGLVLWPGERAFYPLRIQLARRSGDVATAERILGAWRERFPHDAEAP